MSATELDSEESEGSIFFTLHSRLRRLHFVYYLVIERFSYDLKV